MKHNHRIGGGASPKLFEGEKWLVLAGLLGFLLAGVCAVWTLWKGGYVAPDGDVSKAFSFNAAIGIFLLSTAAVSPLSQLKPLSRSIFRWSYIVLALYSYGIETIQNFRGVNPRFVQNGSSADYLFASVFALVALLLVLYYLFFAAAFFRRRAFNQRPEMVLGVRFAMIGTMLSFAAGIWISMSQSRYTGLGGNIIWLHGLGFHALQAIPLVAWLTERTRLSASARRGCIGLAGIAYVLGLVAIGAQTALGRTVFEWSALPIAAAACFLVSLGTAAVVARKALTGSRAGSPPFNRAAE